MPAARLLDQWSCVPVGPASTGGMSVVLPVRRGDGTAAVIKVLDPAAAAREAVALRAFPPTASVLLYDHDADAGALLLERLGDVSVAALDDADAMITVEAELARRLAVADPGGLSLVRDSAGWSEQLRDQQRRAPYLLAGRVVDAAGETISGLARDRTATVTHGDLHAGNVLRDDDGHWRAIDPAPTIGPVAFEAHTVLRDRLGEAVDAGPVELGRRLALFAEVAGADLVSSLRLAQARAVSSALAEHLRGHLPLADQLARMAVHLTPSRPVVSVPPRRGVASRRVGGAEAR